MGECLRCERHVRNGHGSSGEFTYCPPCCVIRNACRECVGIAVELQSQSSTLVLGGSPHMHDVTAPQVYTPSRSRTHLSDPSAVPGNGEC